MGELLRASLEGCPVLDKDGYRYVVHPLTDGVPHIPPDLLREAVDEMAALATGNPTRIVTAEAMGIPLATALSLRLDLPLSIVRKRRYSLPGEVVVDQTTGYGGGQLFINGLEEADRVLLVDDVVSTGGTLGSLLEALEGMGVEVVDVVVLFEKGPGREELEARRDARIKVVQRLEVRGDRVVPVP